MAVEPLPTPASRLRSRPAAAPPVLVLLAAACVFLTVGSLVSSQFAGLVVSGLASGAIFGGLALALVLIYRATGVINFAQGVMATFTTYVAFTLMNHGMPYWGAFVLTLAIAFVFGIGVQLVVIRPVERRGGVLAVVIVTIGILIALEGGISWIWSPQIQFFPSAFSTRAFHVGGAAISPQDLGTLGISIGAVIALWLFFQFTKTGLAMRAAALRPAAARLVGVRVGSMLALGWGLAAVLGAVAGMMAAPTYQLSPTLMDVILIYAFASAVLGGVESPSGAVVGGLALGVLLNLLGGYVHFVSAELRLPVALGVLLVVLVLKPAGLFGRAVVRKV